MWPFENISPAEVALRRTVFVYRWCHPMFNLPAVICTIFVAIDLCAFLNGTSAGWTLSRIFGEISSHDHFCFFSGVILLILDIQCSLNDQYAGMFTPLTATVSRELWHLGGWMHRKVGKAIKMCKDETCKSFDWLRASWGVQWMSVSMFMHICLYDSQCQREWHRGKNMCVCDWVCVCLSEVRVWSACLEDGLSSCLSLSLSFDFLFPSHRAFLK